MASHRQRHQLKRWAKGRSIKVREISEFIGLGWIRYMNETPPGGGYATYMVLTPAGREVIGQNTRTKVPELTLVDH